MTLNQSRILHQNKIHLEEVTVYNGYNNTSGSTASVYTPDKGYTVIYEFRCDKDAYELNSSYSKVKNKFQIYTEPGLGVQVLLGVWSKGLCVLSKSEK